MKSFKPYASCYLIVFICLYCLLFAFCVCLFGCVVKLMVFRNVSPGQEDTSLALHNVIFCTKQNNCATSSSFGVVACVVSCSMHEAKFISRTIYFYPGSDVYCSTTFSFFLSRSTWFFFYLCILTVIFFHRSWFTFVLFFAMVCLHPKTMFAGKAYTIFEWKACFRNHVASIYSTFFSSSLHLYSMFTILLLFLFFVVVVAIYFSSCSSMCFISIVPLVALRKNMDDDIWKMVCFEYLLRLCGEKPNRPNDIVHATWTQHVTTL